MFKDKGFIKFKDHDFEVTINYLNKGDYLLGITLSDSHKVEYFNAHPDITATDGPKGTEFTDVHVTIQDDKELTKAIFDEMTELRHNHFREYDDRLVTVKITVK